MTTRRLLLGAAVAMPAFRPAFAQSQAWPQRPVRFVVSYAPGGPVDLIARVVAEHLGEIWGQPVVVENRPGAGGNLSAQLMVRATPDGHAALISGSNLATNLSLFRNPGYSAEQFRTAAVVAGTPTAFAVRADSPIRTLADLIETARRRPLNFGTAGVGSPSHLLAEVMFKQAGGTDATHVPYAGSGPALAALLAGDIDMTATALPAAVAQIQGNRARGIAVTSERRSRALPDVPTVGELGFGTIVDTTWIAVFFPAATPQALLERVNADVRRALERPAFQQRLAAAGLEPISLDLAAAQTFVANEVVRWRDIVRTVGVQID
jgi:tripartite-type tricarboxylate transporter receptor subunit TctC